MVDLGKAIKRLREERKISQTYLAKRIGCTKQAISHYETGRRGVDYVTLEAIADILNVPMTMFMTPEEQKKELQKIYSSSGISNDVIQIKAFNRIPIVGTIKGGPGGIAYEDIEGYSEAADLKNADEYFYLRVTGDSMSPRIMSGDLALIHKQYYIESGELAAVIVEGDAEPEGTLKKVVKESGAVILEAFNSTVYHPRVFVGEEINRLHIAGKVVRTEARW